MQEEEEVNTSWSQQASCFGVTWMIPTLWSSLVLQIHQIVLKSEEQEQKAAKCLIYLFKNTNTTYRI